MEFRLNKIDTDIRNKMQEQAKSDKIHANEKISIRKDLKKDDNKNEGTEEEQNKKRKKKFFTIDGIKYMNETLDVKAEKIEEFDKENLKGRVLDTKK